MVTCARLTAIVMYCTVYTLQLCSGEHALCCRIMNWISLLYPALCLIGIFISCLLRSHLSPAKNGFLQLKTEISLKLVRPLSGAAPKYGPLIILAAVPGDPDFWDRCIPGIGIRLCIISVPLACHRRLSSLGAPIQFLIYVRSVDVSDTSQFPARWVMYGGGPARHNLQRHNTCVFPNNVFLINRVAVI
ncbi:hypothetical protein J6590_033755 [Homalodisca vitripennis]|nr:hypothetical protein J6590_033755 [Homalodisca vitripennis]